MTSQPKLSKAEWGTPVKPANVLRLFLCCWIGLWSIGVVLMLASAFCAGFVMTVLNVGGAGLPPLPAELSLTTALYFWEALGSVPVYRLLVFVLGYAAMAVPLLVCLKRWKNTVGRPSIFGPRVGFGIRHMTIALATSIAMCAWQALAAIVLSRFDTLHYEHQQTEILALAQSGGPISWTTMLLSCTLFPLLEETLFRGCVYRSLRQPWGLPAALACSALLFGIWHFNSNRLWLFIHTVGIGVLLALSYEVTGSLWVPVAAHGLNNLILFLGQLLC